MRITPDYGRPMVEDVYAACKNCLSINGISLALATVLLIVGASSPLVADRRAEGRLPPVPGGEPPFWSHTPGPFTHMVAAILKLANFSSFQWLLRHFLTFLRTAFLMRDHPP